MFHSLSSQLSQVIIEIPEYYENQIHREINLIREFRNSIRFYGFCYSVHQNFWPYTRRQRQRQRFNIYFPISIRIVSLHAFAQLSVSQLVYVKQ